MHLILQFIELRIMRHHRREIHLWHLSLFFSSTTALRLLFEYLSHWRFMAFLCASASCSRLNRRAAWRAKPWPGRSGASFWIIYRHSCKWYPRIWLARVRTPSWKLRRHPVQLLHINTYCNVFHKISALYTPNHPNTNAHNTRGVWSRCLDDLDH